MLVVKPQRLSFWAKASVDLNVSDISLFAMKPPYKPCAAESEPVLLKGSSGSSGGWRQYSVAQHRPRHTQR